MPTSKRSSKQTDVRKTRRNPRGTEKSKIQKSRPNRDARRRLSLAPRAATSEHRTLDANRFLVDASEVLNSSLDYGETLQRLADLITRSLADWCLIFVCEEEESLPRVVAIAHPDYLQRILLERLAKKYPLDSRVFGGALRSFMTGKTELLSDISKESFKALRLSDEEVEDVAKIHMVSGLLVPIQVRERTIGVFLLFSTRPGARYGFFEIQVAEELGRRAGIAIENARLYGEAQNAIRLREDIVAVVSHDLKNPLGAIKLSSAMIRRTLSKDSTCEIIEPWLERIELTADQMEKLIRDILDMTKIRAGKLLLEIKKERADALLTEFVESFRLVARSKGIELDLDETSQGCDVFVDRARLHQVVSNLIGNALKFTPRGGRVTIGARAQEDLNEVRFWVKDTGPGIRKEDFEKIFSQYWQSAEAESRGTGLGLTIAKAIVETHGGRIWVESEYGNGACFYFSIPRRDS